MAKKRELAALELRLMVNELQLLKGAKVQKVYHPEKKQFILQLHVSGIGKRLLAITFPTFLYLTESKPPQGEPSAFCQAMRNLLGNATIISIKQHAFERIIIIECSGKSSYTLILELFGTGNLIICKDQVIKLVAERRIWKDRTLKRGATYLFPDTLDTSQLDADAFNTLEKDHGFESIVKFFARGLSLGGIYAEEICARAAIVKDNKHLSPAEQKKAYAALQGLFKEPLKPAFFEAGDFAPFPLQSIDGEPHYYGTLSLAVEQLAILQQKKATPQDKERARLRTIQEQQLQHLTKIEQSIVEDTRKGELIFEHYQLIQEILMKMRDIVTKHSAQEITKKLQGHKLIKGFDP
ncbi:MAG: NFACT family protein, partial [Nanoarchaeota archaeon]